MLPGESVELELEGETIHHYEPATRPDRGHHSTTEYCYWVLKPGQEYTGFTVETSDCELEGGLWTITAEEGAADVGEQCLEFVRYCMEVDGDGDHEEEEEEEEEEEDHDWWWFGSEGPGRKNRDNEDQDNEDQDNEDQDNEDQDNEDGDGDHEDGDGDHSALTLKVRVRIFEGSDENNDEEENNDDEQLP